jgi:tetraacyldisaccharide 4'-kinase
MPAVACRFEPTGFVKGANLQATRDITPERVVAACGIAYPAGFFASLQSLGLELVDSVVFRDHHPWSQADLDKLLARTAELGADALVMTEKDLLKLPAVDTKIPVLALRIEARWADETSLSLVNLALEQAVGCLS